MTSAGIAALMATAVVAPSASAADDTTPPLPSIPRTPSVVTPPTDQFIVKFKDPARSGSSLRARSFGRAAATLGATAKDLRATAGGARVVRTSKELGGGDAKKLLASLRADPSVAYAEPDVKLQAKASDPQDTFYPLQWNLSAEIGGIRATGAWDVTQGAGQVVAVIDTGITSHPDLDANMLHGYDMISNPDEARDDDGRDPDATDMGDATDIGQCADGSAAMPSSWHGTHVAGIIAAVAGNNEGIAGVAPEAKILPVRVLGPCGGQTSDIADAVLWASGATVDGVPNNPHPARVINLSLGGLLPECPRAFQDAVDTATARGSVVVAAAGNEMTQASKSTPANCANVVSVAASGPSGALAPYSNFGPGVDITAPGGDMSADPSGGIPSLTHDDSDTPEIENYAYAEGTSAAAPHVSAVAALLMAQMGPTAAPAAVVARLQRTARAIPGGCPQGCGAGLLDAAAAVLPDRVRITMLVPTGDLNGDRKADAVARDSTGTLWLYPGNGRSGWLPRVRVGGGWNVMTSLVGAGDMNTDGKADVLARDTTGSLWLYPGNGRSGWLPRVRLGGGWNVMTSLVGAGDMNSDSKADLLARDSAGTLWLYPGNGRSGWFPRVRVGGGWNVMTALVGPGDMNSDRRADLLARDSAGTLWLYPGNGRSGWLTRIRLGGGWNTMPTIAGRGDFSGDGRNDVLAVDAAGVLWLYPGTGAGAWFPRIRMGGGWG
ncbi:S8 family serine peptidase [Arthrobacter sp. UC242_113]|uniref:S8 family serine peptidase n=1 Tax=Arthrobacter sp. UC242_113 TaxID=3374550 RepID=UPI0037584764